MPNIYRQFLDLIPKEPRQVGDVSAIINGVAIVDLMGGGQVQAVGGATIGQRVFVRAGAIEGPAPTLTYSAGVI